MNNLEIMQFETAVDGDGNVARDVSELRRQVVEIVSAVQVVDLHTHIFPPQFDELSLSGIDELLNYHYLVAELFRFSRVTPAEFWRLENTRRLISSGASCLLKTHLYRKRLAA